MIDWVAPPDGTCANVIHAGSGGVGYEGSIDHWRGLGQAVFQLHGATAEGEVVSRKKMSRK